MLYVQKLVSGAPQAIAHPVDEATEAIIVEALRMYAAFKFMPKNEKSQAAADLADALENDTWLLTTSAPPEDI